MTAKEVRSQIQKLLAVTTDGSIGPKTRVAFEALAKAPGAMNWPPISQASEPDNTEPAPSGDRLDDRTEKVLATLNAKSEPLFRTFMLNLVRHMARKGIVAKLISGTRTCEEQNELFAKGRTTAGPKVTNARCGQSNHNFGCAADVGLFKEGDYLEDSPLYLEIGSIAKPLGLQWGGDWQSIKDYPHVEAKQYKQLV